MQQQQQQAVAYFPENQGVAGYVIFEDSTNKSCIARAYFSKLPPGDHGFHIHKAGDLRGEGCHGACDHFHVGSPCDHGGPPSLRSKNERHTGDLGNISTKAGPFYKSYELEGVSVEDLYGRSVIVHADPDDLGKGPHEDSKTTGHSGKRIACAIIGRTSCANKRHTLKAPKRK